MTTYSERRLSERCVSKTPVEATYFNTASRWRKAEAIDYCMDGMRFRSNCHFLPNAVVLIRVEHYEADGSSGSAIEALPPLAMGSVKWCREAAGETSTDYEIGVEYLPSPY